MANKVIDFPQYRKLSNDKVFYRINSDRDFDEIQLIGTKAQWFTTKAQQYPEILRIMEMLEEDSNVYLLSSQDEFNQLLNNYSL